LKYVVFDILLRGSNESSYNFKLYMGLRLKFGELKWKK